jgi:hypothetical protein
LILAILCIGVGSCSAPDTQRTVNTTVYIPALVNASLSWHAPAYADMLLGARLLYDGPRTPNVTLAITRTVLHTNMHLSPIDALLLSSAVVRAAERNGLPPEFLAATLLQESAFDPQAISAAGAVGIAQFMPDTADVAGIDPFNPYEAIDGAAMLLSRYVLHYSQHYPNTYAVALAAYNAGPGAVDFYHGIPPYAETRDYIADIVDRWARIAGYEKID